MEFIRTQLSKLFEEEDVFYDAVGYDEYFGPSPEGEGAPVDPRNWDLFWVTHPNGPLGESPPDPELEFPREVATQGLIDCLLQNERKISKIKREDDLAAAAAAENGVSASDDTIAEDLRSSIAELSTLLETEELALASSELAAAPPEPAAVSPEPAAALPEPSAKEPSEPVTPPSRPPASLFTDIRSLFPTISLPKLKLPSVKLPSLKLPSVKLPSVKLPSLKLPSVELPFLKFPSVKLPSLKLSSVKLPTLSWKLPIPAPKLQPVVKKEPEPEPLHYARTPLATYARVKSRLQDRPPLVAAAVFADEVAGLSPSSLLRMAMGTSLVPMAASEGQQVSRNSRTSVLWKNLRDLLPTPVAAMLTSERPRKRSLVSILGGRAAKKVMAEIEHDPLDDSMIPQYQKWKKIKNKHVHNAQWSFLITACILLICAIHIEKLREIKWWKFEFWQWLALGFVALAGRLVSGWCVKLMVILIEYNFLLKKRILYFIFGLRRPVKSNLWLAFILLTWTLVVQHTPDMSDTIPTVTKLLMCAFTASTLWVIKVLLVKILADTFHRTAYFDRIQDSLFHQYVLEVLSEPRSHRHSHGRGVVGGRGRAAPVFKLRVAPSQKKVTARDARKQGRIERQYSPILSKFRPRKDKRLEPRTPAWAKYEDNNDDSSVLTSWLSKIPSIFPFALITSGGASSGSPPRSPRFRPQFPTGDGSAMGVPANLKGGADILAGTLERKSSLKQAAGDAQGERDSQMKVTFPEMVEEQTSAHVVVESSPSPAALLLEPEDDNATTQGALVDIELETNFQAQEKTLIQTEEENTQAKLKQLVGVLQEQVPPPLVDPLVLALGTPLVESVAAAAETPGDAPAPDPPAVVPVVVPVVLTVPVVNPVLIPAEKPPPFVEPDIEMEEGELEDEAGHEQQTTLAQDKIQVLTKDSVSAWTLMRLMKVVRTRNLHMYSKTSLVEPDWEIDSIPMVTAAAKYIFKNVAEPGQQELLLKNFMKLFTPNKATQAFSTFEVTVDGTITKQGLLKWVLDVYKERKSLSLTLNDNRTVIYQINLLLDGVLIAVILAISFLIMSFNNKALLVCTTILLSPAVSIFGNLLRNTFESILFLFIVHPFDVGDRVSVEGVPLMVEEMRIMSTMFLNNSSEHITYPNFILINKPISNIHRSPDQWDAIECQILAHTSLEKLSILRNRIDKYVVGLPQIWYPRWRLIVKDIENTNRLRLVMTIQHHINFQDAGERTQRRSDMLVHIQALMSELKIGYELPQGQALVTKLPLGFP